MRDGFGTWRRRSILTATVALFALSGCGGGGGGGDAKNPSDASDGGLIGKQAPEVVAEAVGGDGPTTLAESKGTVTIVDFWATYCDPCRKSFPKYQELVDKHAGDLVVIAVSVDDPEDVGTEEVLAFAEELNVTFPIVWDKERATADAYNPPKMPTSYVIDKEGVVRHIHEGYQADEADVIADEVAALLE
jgi:thiol-disulfide isomerase/thioredoxin